MKEPTIPLEELEALAREAFGAEFVKLVAKPRVRRSETLTVYIISAKHLKENIPPPPCGYTHTLKYSNEKPKGDPDAVRKFLCDSLRGVIAKRASL
jgi:hypothetical protein